MNCDAFMSLLSRWPDGELTAQEQEQMHAHAIGCPTCAQRLSLAREAHEILAGLDEQIEMPQAFVCGWRQAVRREAFARLRRIRPLAQGFGAVAASFALLLGGTALWRRGLLPIAYPGDAQPQAYMRRAMPAMESAPVSFWQDAVSCAKLLLPWALAALAILGAALLCVSLIRRKKRKE